MPSQADISQPFFVQQETASALSEKAAPIKQALVSIRLHFNPSHGHQNFLWLKPAVSYQRREELVAGEAQIKSNLSWGSQVFPHFFPLFFSLETNTFPKAEISIHIIPHCRDIPQKHFLAVVVHRPTMGPAIDRWHTPSTHPYTDTPWMLRLSPLSSPTSSFPVITHRASEVASFRQSHISLISFTVQTGNF